MRALVADASVTMRRILANVLAKAGFERVDQAGGGEAAVTSAAVVAYDLMVLDACLPGLSGLEVLQTLRTRGLKMPVVLIGTDTDKRYIMEVIRAGIECYVIKPFEPERMLERIKGLLAKTAA
jgi:two-component system chemotaxis response regulator CheY